SQSEAVAPTLKSVLIEQLKGAHNHEDWFVPVNIAIEGLTAEQANWKGETENHSIVQLVNHLIFWNQQYLAKFKGDKPTAFNGDNKETLNAVGLRSEEHTSELQSLTNLVCRLLLEKKKTQKSIY